MVFHQQFKDILVEQVMLEEQQPVEVAARVLLGVIPTQRPLVQAAMVVMELLQYSPVLDFTLNSHHLILMV
jgi:hypothetical protein